MLHLETVEPRTFALLKKIMSIRELKDFSLVGGTALSLVYGHRISVDLDICNDEKFKTQRLKLYYLVSLEILSITKYLKMHFLVYFVL